MNLKDFEQMFREGIYVHRNKTKTYLAVVMSEYGEDYINKMQQLSTTGVYVDDAMLSIIKDTDYCLFYLFNVHKSVSKGTHDFNARLEEFRKLDFYVHDYPFGELFGGKLHTVVFRVPEKHYRAYDIFAGFKKGLQHPVYYSKMFSPEDVERLFVALFGKNSRAVKVFRKDPKWKEEFETEINRYGIYANQNNNVEWIILDPKRDEYEYRPNPSEEVLNFRSHED